MPALARLLRTCLLAGVAAGLAAVAGPQGFWAALPVALIAAAVEPLRAAALLSAGAVLAGAALVAAPVGAVAAAAPAAVGVLLAVRRRLEREREAQRAHALRDPLTGLGNRRMLAERLRYELTRHARAGERLALVVFDLDGFKGVNDRFGHEAGDEVLRDVAAALRDVVRGQDTVVRLGGDEFCVLAPQTGADGAAQLIGRVDAALAGLGLGAAGVSASGGAAVFPDDSRQADALLSRADAAALAAKRRAAAGPRGARAA